MQVICTIYRTARERELYLYVEKGKDLSELPAELMTRLGKTEEVMTLLLTADRKLARVNAERVLEDIKQKGYFLQLPPTLDGQLYHGD